MFPMRKVMKVLFVDQIADLQQKLIEPLRKEGWGAFRARSAADAEKMMMIHGDSVDAIVVAEDFVSFAEKWEIPFLVLTRTWTENQILKHQNSKASGFAYVSAQTAFGEIMRKIELRLGTAVNQMKATGTEGQSRSILLEDCTRELSNPGIRIPNAQTTSIKLVAPSVLLGGKENPTRSIEIKRPELSLVVSTPEPEPVKESVQEPAEDNRTVILDATQLQAELEGRSDISLITPEVEEVSLSFDNEVSIPSFEESYTRQNVPAASPTQNQFAIDPSPKSMPSDVETLRSYLALREQDVALLSGQVRSSHERIQQLEVHLKVERARAAELQQIAQKNEQVIQGFEHNKKVDLEVMNSQVQDLNAQLKDRSDKARMIEAKLKLATEEVDKVKERVRVDIRRIRVREKELENQLEILKKDSSALLVARDEKILELKRKLDLLEFNMELVQEQYQRERGLAEDLRNRLKDAAQAMRQAGGILDA